MKYKFPLFRLLPIYIIVIVSLIFTAIGSSYAVTALSESAPIENRKCIIIDAGHGGEDGGAVSCTGVLESQINLEIALRLNDLLNLLGIKTVMIRKSDCSIYTQGDSIAEKKISDLKERVRIVNSTPNSILISIHQNQFTESKYSGAQVFYAPTNGSQALAEQLQSSLIQTLNTSSKRTSKKSDGIYLMKNIIRPGVLLECGFLSNPEEEHKLRDSEYQKQLCCVIASVCSNYLHG